MKVFENLLRQYRNITKKVGEALSNLEEELSAG